MNNTQKRFVDRFQEAIGKAGMSLRDLSQKTGISIYTIKMWSRGSYEPRSNCWPLLNDALPGLLADEIEALERGRREVMTLRNDGSTTLKVLTGMFGMEFRTVRRLALGQNVNLSTAARLMRRYDNRKRQTEAGR